MYGYVYETINLLNGKRYIGKHVGQFNINYLGSGLRLHNSIKKYGKKNFSVNLLEKCNSKKELNHKEIELISKKDACRSDLYYNIAAGGEGGDITQGYTEEEYINFCKKSSIWNMLDKNSSEGINLRKKFGNKKENNPMYGKVRSYFKEIVLKSNATKVKCPHCGIIANLGNSQRWHFDNCKKKM